MGLILLFGKWFVWGSMFRDGLLSGTLLCWIVICCYLNGCVVEFRCFGDYFRWFWVWLDNGGFWLFRVYDFGWVVGIMFVMVVS